MDYIIYDYQPNVKAYWQFLHYYLWTTYTLMIFMIYMYYLLVSLHFLTIIPENGINILNASIETAEVFGEMKNALKVAGTPLPINDVWIAAHSLENGAVLVTYDRHFKKIAGLRLWDYLS